MKALKTTLLLASIFLTLASCTKQDLDEGDVLESPETEETHHTGGNGQD